MPTVPGAIGASGGRRSRTSAASPAATLAEDTDLTIGHRRAGWRVVYAEDARAWTEAPATLGQLWRQRYRWCYGTMQAMWKHRAAFWRPWRAGGSAVAGCRTCSSSRSLLPLLRAGDRHLCDLRAPLPRSRGPILGFWIAFSGPPARCSAGTRSGSTASHRGLLWAMPLQQFVYRQLMYLVVIESLLSAVGGTPTQWRSIPRRGEVEVAGS